MKKLIVTLYLTGISCVAQQYRTTSTAKIIDSITVILNEPVQAKSLSGFLGGTDNPSYPDRNAIRALQPKLMRTSHPVHYAEAYNLAGRVHFIISDEWKQLDNDNDGQIDLFDAKPYIDKSFEDYLDNLFIWGYNGGNIRPGIVWECWNEPDNNNFSGWVVQDFYETYKLTYTKLRKSRLGTSALVAGPSFGTFDKQLMKDFFDYCLTNNLEVNVVTWHEITYLDQQKPLITLQEHVMYIRDNFVNNPKYAPLKMQSIEINEIVNPEDKNRPSEIAGYLRNLEDAGVDYACKSCFTHNTNIDAKGSVLNEGGIPPCELGSCSDTSFNDLFTIWYDSENYVNNSNICNPLPGNEHKTKSGWWVYKLYADGVPFRVKSTGTEPRSNVISSSKVQPYPDAGPTNKAQILVGYSNEWPQNNLPDTGTYTVHVNSLATINATAKIFRVKIFQIPFNGADSYNKAEDNDELANPVLVSSAYYLADANNGITINFTAKTDDLYQITISAD